MCRLLAFAASSDVNPDGLFQSGELEAHRNLSTLHGDGWGYALSTSDSTRFDVCKSTKRAIDADRGARAYAFRSCPASLRQW